MEHFSIDKKIELLSLFVFMVGLALISYANYWWPGIMGVIAVTGMFKTVLRGQFFWFFVCFIVFGGIFILALFETSHAYMQRTWVLPGVFLLIAVYVLVRTFMGKPSKK